jgi:hypothetical protein
MKKKIYKWHRTLSIIIAVPVILWAASGFMHPVMTNIRPKIATQGLMPVAVDSNKIQIPLQAALQKNRIDSFSNFRLVHIDTNWFYQLQLKENKPPVYLSANNGKILPAGDWLYAQYLARQFLEGQELPVRKTVKAIPAAFVVSSLHDCCNAATDCVLNGTKGSKVTSTSLLADFDDEYKSINRLLPVYRVSFDRPDGIRVYVETTQDRFAFAIDNKRAVFDTIFRICHTWGWLDFLGKGKLIVIFTLALLAFCTALMGIYIFFTTKSKKANGNGLVKARRNHRYISIIAALFTLLWTFSGGYHALYKLKEDDSGNHFIENRFAAAGFDFNFSRMSSLAQKPIVNISLVKINKETYWQVNTKTDHTANKDLMKAMKADMPSVMYVNTSYHSILPDGDLKYARYLATQFSGHQEEEIRSAEAITQFNDEYNFTDKRLPVWKIGYASNGHERYYVETVSGKLSVRVDDNDFMEGYSFAIFHKHHFMDWGGKSVRDFSTMFWALAQIVMVTFGLILYFKWRSRKTR